MKKRRISMVLILALLTSMLAACGNEHDNDADTDPVDSSSEAEVSEDTVDSLPAGLDFGGAEFNIMIGDYAGAYLDDLYQPEETGNRLSDTVYQMIQNVQERLNISLNYSYETYVFDDMSAHQTKITSGILAGDNDFDLLFDNPNYTMQMLEGNYFENLADNKYIDLDQPYYNQDVRDNYANDYVHFITGQFSLANIKYLFAVYFNADLYEDIGGTENLYELVDAGKWTIDKLDEITKNSYADLNGDTIAGPEDRYGIAFGDANKYYGFLKPMGINMFEKSGNDYIFTYGNERANEAYERLRRFINENENTAVTFWNDDTHPDWQISTGGGNYASKLFVEGRALFNFGLISDSATIVPMIDFEYGLLPYPKYKEDDEYQIMGQRHCYAMIPTTTASSDMSGAVLEALSSESYRTLVPEYCEVSLKTRYSQDNDVSRMFDLIIKSETTDPGEIYSDYLNYPNSMIRNKLSENSESWASEMAKVKSELIEKMNAITNR
ncbi:MAG: extracellular solute-binding protein [Clostridiales bacterium]|nr:extracellular solute-binding protein [Clostridiales bacterium]